MSSFCEDAYRYGPRVGVPPAKSIKTILEEQARRNKKIPEETSQASEATEETADNERCTEEVISERERKENKDRYEYEVTLEEKEEDGKLPSGWTKVQEEGRCSPMVDIGS